MLTDTRLLFFFDGLLNKQSEDFPLSIVSTVTASSGLLNATVRIVSGGHHTEIRRCPTADASRLAGAARTALAASRAAQTLPSQPATAPPDIAAQIRQLGELKNAGLLTDVEFDTKKQELLSRM